MGIFDVFRRGKGTGATARSCVIDAQQSRVYDALVNQFAPGKGAGLNEESIARIKQALAPLAKLGGDVDGVLGKIELRVDTSARPGTLRVSTAMGEKAIGPSTILTLERATATTTRVRLTMQAEVPGGMLERMLMASARKQMEESFEQSADTVLNNAAAELKAKITFEDAPAKS